MTLNMDVNRTIDVRGIAQSADRVDAIVRAQIDVGIDPNRIILVGFSQGVLLRFTLAFAQRTVGRYSGIVNLLGWRSRFNVIPRSKARHFTDRNSPGRLIPWSLMLESKHVTRCLRYYPVSLQAFAMHIPWCLNFGPSDSGWHTFERRFPDKGKE